MGEWECLCEVNVLTIPLWSLLEIALLLGNAGVCFEHIYKRSLSALS